jgi:hypothetical protein
MPLKKHIKVMINLQNITDLQQQFKNIRSFTHTDLYDFFRSSDTKKSEADFLWYLYELKDKNIIKPLEKGVYKLLQPKRNFEPLLNEQLYAVQSLLLKDFNLLNTCLWSTEWLNEFTIHQSTQTYTLLEVEDSASESVFYHLRDNGFKNVFLKPDALLMNRYVSETENPIIVLKLMSRSPLTSLQLNKGAIKMPKLEKILIDLYCDDVLFTAYKGQELYQIFEYALKNYAINFTTLFAYAERRKRRDAIVNYLDQYFKEIIKEIIL